MPTDVPLTPRAARRLAREAATQPYEKAARALREDWNTELDRKQVQRWAQTLGRHVVGERDAELLQSACGRGPRGPANAPALLVVQMDGGRVQMTEANPETGSRWREDKVAVVGSYQPGNGLDEPARSLVKTHVATLSGTERFGEMVRVEAERRGLSRATEAIVLADGGNWIDPLIGREFAGLPRIIDWYHAVEHLHACRRALYPDGSDLGYAFEARLEEHLWEDRVERVIETLATRAQALGPPQGDDGEDHPRRVLANNVGYFERHREHMAYATYRARGWPIGSGAVEGAVKQVNKRVKGTEQAWTPEGLEPILALRALWLSQDDRWSHYWTHRPAYPKKLAA